MRIVRTITVASLAVSLLAGTAVGAAGQDEGYEPLVVTSFTGSRTTQQDQVSDGTTSTTGGLEEVTGSGWVGSMVSTDERLTGTFTATDSWVVDTTEMAPDLSNFNVVVASTWELANDGGRWLIELTSFGDIESGVNTGWMEFVGQDGYDGLTAYARADWLNSPQFVGTIFSRPMPDNPEPYAAEPA